MRDGFGYFSSLAVTKLHEHKGRRVQGREAIACVVLPLVSHGATGSQRAF